MKSNILLLFVFGFLAAGGSASTSDPPKNENGEDTEGMLGSALLPVLAPSQQKVAMERSFAEHTAKALKPVTTPEQLDALRRMFNASISYEEKLLEVYTRMQELAQLIDSLEDLSEREPLSKEMKSLIAKYREICEEREKAPVEAGLITESALEGLLAVPEIQAVKEAIKNLVLSKFYKYT